MPRLAPAKGWGQAPVLLSMRIERVRLNEESEENHKG
jgi:hypothetical protein